MIKYAPFSGSTWLPTENRVIIVGGLAGWNSEIRKYEYSNKIIVSIDKDETYLIEKGNGPHLLACCWNPIDKSAILIGAFDTAFKYSDGKIIKKSFDYEK